MVKRIKIVFYTLIGIFCICSFVSCDGKSDSETTTLSTTTAIQTQVDTSSTTKTSSTGTKTSTTTTTQTKVSSETTDNRSSLISNCKESLDSIYRSGAAKGFNEDDRKWLEDLYQSYLDALSSLSDEELKNYSVEEVKEQIDHQWKTNYEVVNMTLSEVYDALSLLTLDSKGTAIGQLVKVKVTCTARVDSSVLYFNDEERTIKIHGLKDDKLWNYCQVGNVYEITGNIGIYKYQPQIDNVTPERMVRVNEIGVECKKKQISAAEVFGKNYGDYSLYGYMLEVTGNIFFDVKNTSKEIPVITNANGTKHTLSGRYIGLYLQNYEDKKIIDYFKDSLNGDSVTLTVMLYDTFRDHSKDFFRVYMLAQD